MKRFIEYLNEASGGFIHFPKSDSDIDSLDFLSSEKKESLKSLLSLVQKQSGMSDPLALNASSPNIVKVSRVVAADLNLKSLSKQSSFSLSAGNGSRGGRGSQSKGFSFEGKIVSDVEKYIASGMDSDFSYPDMMQEMEKLFLKGGKDISVRLDGTANTKRPLMVDDVSMLIGGRDLNVGPKVTDVTVTVDGKDHYVSAKFGGTVTFFNVGVGKIFTQDQFKAGKFTNRSAQFIINAFGIDEKRFIDIFESYNDNSSDTKSKKELVDVTGRIDKKKLQQMLLTGVGYGYYMAHQKGKKVEFYEMTPRKMIDSAKIQKVTIQYPAPGSAKRLDIEVLTPRYVFKINIRNKQGGLYPSHIMADYKYR